MRFWPPTAATGQAELTIKKAASRLGLTADILRNWEKNGLLDVPRDPTNGYRLYGEEHLRRCLAIRLLFQAGFGAAAILRTLRHLDAGRAGDPRRVLDTPPPDEEIRYATDRWLTTLGEQERRAEQIVAQVEAMVEDMTP